jgi:hypothetical protein
MTRLGLAIAASAFVLVSVTTQAPTQAQTLSMANS